MAITSAASTMNGKFRIESAKFPNYVLNVYGTSVASGRNVCLFPLNPSDLLQQWIPQSQGNNVYKLSTAQVNSCTIVIDHYRATPVDNCDMYTSASSSSTGGLTTDLTDQQIQFIKESDGTYTIYLYDGGECSKALTCAASVDEYGVGSPSSITEKNNVYWAAQNSSLGNRQRWKITWLAANPSVDTILPYAQAYVQRDNTWAYLAAKNDLTFAQAGCAVCALSTCGAIIRKKNSLTPKTCLSDGGFSETDLNAKWSIYGIAQRQVCPKNFRMLVKRFTLK